MLLENPKKPAAERNFWRRIALVLALTVPSWVMAYMLGAAVEDQDPPYVRKRGEILAMDPSACNIPSDDNLGKVAANACVVIKWEIDVDQKRIKECDIVSTEHVSRIIYDGDGAHSLPPTKNVYGGSNGKKLENPLIRPFILPAFSRPGPAAYWSEARFACNWLQRLFPNRYAIRINEPTVAYVVE